MQKTFEAKVKVAYLIGQLPAQSKEQKEIYTKYLKELHQAVIDLDEKRFRVQAQMRQVNEYRHEAKWQHLSQNDLLELSKHIAPLIIGLFFFIGLQFIFIGVIGEYIGSIHTYSQNRPLVVVKEKINFN